MNTAEKSFVGGMVEILRWVIGVLSVFIGILTVLALMKYPGEGLVYLVFTLTANALLYFGFGRGAIFFDTFIGIFMWLGFWLKLSVRVAFLEGGFHEAVGAFDGSGGAFDHALIVSTCGFLGLLVASGIRRKWLFSYRKVTPAYLHKGILVFYRNHRTLILVGLVFLTLVVAVSNFWLGIYQRGNIPRTVLPFGLNGVYTWLLLFGLSSFWAVILRLDYELSGKLSTPIVGLFLLDSFFSNLSLLSRGMILNSSALFLGVFAAFKIRVTRHNLRQWVIIGAIFGCLFLTSIFAVNYLRSWKLYGDVNLAEVRHSTRLLFLDRWVGIEGVLAVTGSPDRGWDLWNRAWSEEYKPELGFYDANLIVSPYVHTDMTKVHHVSLPGLMAFFYYPGSLLFLFGCLFFAGLLGAGCEWFVFKIGGGNLILCALLSQVVAYRFAHFGYMPKQSYLLFGSLILNVLIIAIGNQILVWWYRRKGDSEGDVAAEQVERS